MPRSTLVILVITIEPKRVVFVSAKTGELYIVRAHTRWVPMANNSLNHNRVIIFIIQNQFSFNPPKKLQ